MILIDIEEQKEGIKNVQSYLNCLNYQYGKDESKYFDNSNNNSEMIQKSFSLKANNNKKKKKKIS